MADAPTPDVYSGTPTSPLFAVHALMPTGAGAPTDERTITCATLAEVVERITELHAATGGRWQIITVLHAADLPRLMAGAEPEPDDPDVDPLAFDARDEQSPGSAGPP